MKELAQDLKTRLALITGILRVLPGVERGEEEQEMRIRELKDELERVEVQRGQKVEECEEGDREGRRGH